jgi:hypothetical protein
VKQTSFFPDPAAERRDNHTCHARGCEKRVKPEFLMCSAHWRRVPSKIQASVWVHYRNGQCDDMRPSREWYEAASAAIGAVARLEGKPLTKSEHAALEKYEAK